MVPSAVAGDVTKALTIPTISVGASPHCDGQVMVWTDWAGFRTGRIPKFVKKYADIRFRESFAAFVAKGMTPYYLECEQAGIAPRRSSPPPVATAAQLRFEQV